ncbi:hypothetical protein Stsp02_63410 [Streptomyces sp. NBRC 14336]|nr:hypothetical protein Stsp02_63410 [Streptomyces sp. NBRC 14336]
MRVLLDLEVSEVEDDGDAESGRVLVHDRECFGAVFGPGGGVDVAGRVGGVLGKFLADCGVKGDQCEGRLSLFFFPSVRWSCSRESCAVISSSSGSGTLLLQARADVGASCLDGVHGGWGYSG